MNNTNNNGRTWGIVIAVIVVILVIFLLVRHNKQVAVAPGTDTQDNSALTADGNAVEDTTEGSVHATTPAVVLSYNQALAAYKDHRIQFDKSCQATGNINQTFKSNTELMLDNRSPNTRTLHLGFLGTITIKPWGFKIVNFSSATLPRAVIIDCDSFQNVATVPLQK